MPTRFAHAHDYLNEAWAGRQRSLVTRLMRHLWESRPDLQEAYPDLGGADAEDFARHFVAELAAEASVPERFVSPARDALRLQEAAECPRGPASHASPTP